MLKKSVAYISAILASTYVQANEPTSFEALLDLSIEELVNVTITAQKKPEKIQSTPAAVSAISQLQLQNHNISDISQIGSLVPGLVMGITGYDIRPAMRGVRTQQVEHNDAAISVYQDGISRPRHAQAMLPFLDVERIEILHGPQGTLFGRNSFGGTFSIHTQQPALNDSSLAINLGLGSYDQQKLTAIANLGLTDKLAVRFSGLLEQRDPLVENEFNPDAGINDKNSLVGRLQLLYQFTPNLSVNLSLQKWQEDSNGNGIFGVKVIGIPWDSETNTTHVSADIIPRIGRSDDCLSSCGRYGAGLDFVDNPELNHAEKALPSPYKISSDYPPSTLIDELSFKSEVNLKTKWADIKLLTAHMDFSDFRLDDTDFSHYSSIIQGYDMTSKTKTLELQATSNLESNWRWVAGLYYLSEQLDYAYLWQDIIALKDNRPDPDAEANYQWASWLRQLQMQTNSKALYGQISYQASDKLSVTTGLRYTDDNRHWDIVKPDTSDLSQLNFNQTFINNANDDWDAFTWKLGLNYQLNQDSLLYASASTGFLAGNFKSGDTSYDEQNVLAYEIGSKNFFFNKQLRLNLSAYYNHYSDLLATHFVEQDSTAIGVVDNAGNISAYGIETHLDWRPTENTLISLTADYKHARYGDFVATNQFQSGGQTINGVDNLFQLDGEQVALSPDYTVSLTSQYTFDLGQLGQLSPRMQVYLSDSYQTSDQPYRFGQQDAYQIYNFYLNWQSLNEKWQAQLYIKNAFDKAVKLKANRFGGNVAVLQYADPTQFGLNLTYQFEL